MANNVPLSSLTSYASIDNLIDHTDIRVLADCVLDDGTRAGGYTPTSATLQANPTAVERLQDALNKASGMIEMEVFVGGKYTAQDLADLVGMGLALLQSLVCDLATWRLMQRRYPTLAITEQYRNAMEMLMRLRAGEAIFSLTDQAAAGIPAYQFITPQTVNRVNMSSVQAGRFYGNRNKFVIGRGANSD